MRETGLALAVVLLLAGCGDDSEAPASPADARTCLAKAHLRVLGGPRSPDDRDAPETELIVSGSASQAFLAFYDDEQRAQQKSTTIAQNAKAFRGTVERHGRLTIVWARGQKSSEADKIRACVA